MNIEQAKPKLNPIWHLELQLKLRSQTVSETNGGNTDFTEDTNCFIVRRLNLGLHPTILQDWVLLLRGLTLRVVMCRCEVSFSFGDGGPEESTGLGPGEVHGYVEVVRSHRHKVARVVLVVH